MTMVPVIALFVVGSAALGTSTTAALEALEFGHGWGELDAEHYGGGHDHYEDPGAATDVLKDALLDVSEADGSTRLRFDGADLTPVLLGPGLHQDEPRPAIGVGDSLLNVLLAVNGLDHSLLSLNRVDDTLLPALPPLGRGCGVTTCRGQCQQHGCVAGYCDAARRCRCLC